MDPLCRSPIRRRRRAAAGAVLAGAALLGVFGAAPARARAATTEGPRDGAGANEEIAFAVPRVSPPGGHWGGVGLPQPLTPADAARIRQIYALQDSDRVPAADALIGDLDDTVILGDILAARYLRPGARPAAAALRDWLARYGDQVEAPSIRAALRAVSPRGAGVATAPPALAAAGPLARAPASAETDPAAAIYTPRPALDARVAALLADGRDGDALRAIGAARGIGPIYGAVLRASVARALFSADRDAEALAVGAEGAALADGRVGAPAYVAALAAWRLGRLDEAASLFETASRAPLIAESERAGADFWAARAHLARGDLGGYRPWMLRAAAFHHTFYGMLAARRLGIGGWTEADDEIHPEVGRGELGEADVEALAALPAGRRAFALLQVGRTADAEATLRHLWPRVSGDPALCRSIMLVARAAGLDDLAATIASVLDTAEDAPDGAAGARVPALRPRGGFTVDPALVYALTRVESDFDAHAVSDAGAHGLMQIEPVTADFVAGARHRFASNPSRLANASLNLQIGQLYVQYLASSGHVGGSLIRLLASYNAGPNRVALWHVRDADAGDPLLFIERIPCTETRDFVHRALAYLWIYAGQLGLPAPSLDALAADIWPGFAPEVAMADARVTLH